MHRLYLAFPLVCESAPRLAAQKMPENVSLAFRSVDIDLSWINEANQTTGIGRISFSDDGKRVYVPFQRGFEGGVIFLIT